MQCYYTSNPPLCSAVPGAAAPLAAAGGLQVRVHRVAADGRRARHRRVAQGVRKTHRRHRGREGQNGRDTATEFSVNYVPWKCRNCTY